MAAKSTCVANIPTKKSECGADIQSRTSGSSLRKDLKGYDKDTVKMSVLRPDYYDEGGS